MFLFFCFFTLSLGAESPSFLEKESVEETFDDIVVNQDFDKEEAGKESFQRKPFLIFLGTALLLIFAYKMGGKSLKKGKFGKKSGGWKEKNKRTESEKSRDLTKKPGPLPIKKMCRLKWERNSCFTNTVFQIFIAAIPEMIEGGIQEVLSWKDRFKEPKTKQEAVVKAFSELVAAVEKANRENKDQTLTEEPKELRRALGEIDSEVNSGDTGAVKNLFDLLKKSLIEGLGEKESTLPLEDKDIETPDALEKKARTFIDRDYKEKKLSSLFDFTQLERRYSSQKKKNSWRIFNKSIHIVLDSKKNQIVDLQNKLAEKMEDHAKSYWLRVIPREKCQSHILQSPKLLPLFMNLQDESGKNRVDFPFENLPLSGNAYDLFAVVVESSTGNNVPHFIVFIKSEAKKMWWKLDDFNNKAALKKEDYLKDYLKNKIKSSFGPSDPTLFLYKRREEGVDKRKKERIKVPSLIDQGYGRYAALSKGRPQWVENFPALEKEVNSLLDEMAKNNQPLLQNEFLDFFCNIINFDKAFKSHFSSYIAARFFTHEKDKIEGDIKAIRGTIAQIKKTKNSVPGKIFATMDKILKIYFRSWLNGIKKKKSVDEKEMISLLNLLKNELEVFPESKDLPKEKINFDFLLYEGFQKLRKIYMKRECGKGMGQVEKEIEKEIAKNPLMTALDKALVNCFKKKDFFNQATQAERYHAYLDAVDTALVLYEKKFFTSCPTPNFTLLESFEMLHRT